LTTATGSSATFNGIVSNGGIIKNGNGTLIMGAAESTYSGGTTLNAGTLSFGTTRIGSVGNITSSSLGTGSLTLNGGTLTGSSGATRAIWNAVTIGGDVTFGDGVNNGTLNFSADVDLGGATRTLTIANNSVSFNGVVANGGLTKAGNTLVLTGNNTYTGATTISSGTLQIGNGGAVGSIDSTSSVNNNGALIYNRNNSSTASYAIGGSGTLEKQGAGTLTLTGNNTYTGGTTVSTGTLLVNNTSGSGTGSGSLLVSAGATLGGSGAIAGITTISGILAPGNSIGTLTVANDVTWNGSLLSDGTANWKFELGAANTADLLRITGGASEFIKGSGSVFCFDFLGSTETGTFTLVDWDSTAFVGGGFEGGTSFAATDFTYTNLGNSNTGTFQFNGSQLQFQAIPEPSAGVLMLLAGTALFVLRHRRMQ
jgi:autotransporter-associated beta strand protein